MLLPRPRAHENLDYLAVSTSVPHEEVPICLLVLACSGLLLHNMDSGQQYICLRSCASFLDQGTRTMHRPICDVVYECDNQHPNGLCYHHTADARHQTIATWKATEICAHGYFCRWWEVSTTFFALSHVHQTRVR